MDAGSGLGKTVAAGGAGSAAVGVAEAVGAGSGSLGLNRIAGAAAGVAGRNLEEDLPPAAPAAGTRRQPGWRRKGGA